MISKSKKEHCSKYTLSIFCKAKIIELEKSLKIVINVKSLPDKPTHYFKVRKADIDFMGYIHYRAAVKVKRMQQIGELDVFCVSIKRIRLSEKKRSAFRGSNGTDRND